MRRLFRKYQHLVCCFMLLLGTSLAAPLPTGNAPAQDAVALLREWGLVDGYPDQAYRWGGS